MSACRMSSGRRALAAAMAFALVVNPAVASAQANVVGVNAAVRNVVQIRRGNAPATRAALRQRVAIADQISTGPASQLQILLLDRSVFTVGSNARLTIDRFVYDPARSSRSVGASATRGAFRFMSGRQLRRPAGSVSVRTPVASIGVRGTIFEGAVGADAMRIAASEPALGAAAGGDPETASLIILRGPGPAAQGNSTPGSIEVRAGGRTILLDRPGQALYVPRAGVAPVGPFTISDAGLTSMQLLLGTVPSAAGLIGTSAASGGGQSGTGGSVGPQAGGGGTTGGGSTGGGGGDRSIGGWLLPGIGVAAAVLVLLLTNGGGGEEPPESP